MSIANTYVSLLALELVFDLLTEDWQQYGAAFRHFEQIRVDQLFHANHFPLGQAAVGNVRDDFHDCFAV